MATYIAGPTGAGAQDGSNWANRLAGLNAVEDLPITPGDFAWFGPGVYREELTIDVPGGNAYVVGTVDVTNGSKQVDGNGTAWVANVAADYMFHIAIYASGNDGVANGTATFTSAGGNFQANMIGKVIQINTRGAYEIGAVAAANSITLVDVNGLGWPGAGGGLTYSVMSGEGHYDIDSVDDNTTIQLKQPWNGPTLTAIAYITFNPIRYVADVTGEHTDGVGGKVRITASDDDETSARTRTILGTSGDDYRTFRGFLFDFEEIELIDCDHWVIEDCVFHHCSNTVIISNTSTNMTIRRCLMFGTSSYVLQYEHTGTVDDTGHLVESCLFIHCRLNIRIVRIGGMTFRNNTPFGGAGIRVFTALSIGQQETVNNCIFQYCGTALRATALGEIVEDYNTFSKNAADRDTVAIGVNSETKPALFQTPLLHSGASQISGFKFPWWFGSQNEWSQIKAIAGTFEAYGDLHGVPYPVITGGVATSPKLSWGASQFQDMEIETGTVQAGTYSRVLHDAGSVLVRRVPVTGVEITVTLYMRFEADYEPDPASLPWMVIKQPGQVDRTTVMTVAANNWEQLTDTFTPASPPGFIEVWVESRNITVPVANYEVFWDTMDVS